jgi:hypothetical protein
MKEEKDSHGIQCFECSGYGHLHKDCANLKVGRPKAHFATLSDSNGDDVDGKKPKARNATLSDSNRDEVGTNYVAFVAPHDFYVSNFSDDDSNDGSNVQFPSKSESQKERNRHSSYNNLCENFNSLRKENGKNLKMIEELKLERDNLLQYLNDSRDVCHSLKTEKPCVDC